MPLTPTWPPTRHEKKVLTNVKITIKQAMLTTAVVWQGNLSVCLWAANIQEQRYNVKVLRVLVSVRRDDVSNATVCCVVFNNYGFLQSYNSCFCHGPFHFGFVCVCVCVCVCVLCLMFPQSDYQLTVLPQFFPSLLPPPHRHCISLISLSLLPVFPRVSSVISPLFPVSNVFPVHYPHLCFWASLHLHLIPSLGFVCI